MMSRSLSPRVRLHSCTLVNKTLVKITLIVDKNMALVNDFVIISDFPTEKKMIIVKFFDPSELPEKSAKELDYTA